MQITRILIPLPVVVLLLNGCASLSKEECLGGNWERIGYEDGVAGRTNGRIYQHGKACSEYNVVPDRRAYEAGRKTGLEQVYCRPGNGYRQGLAGRQYRDVCPSGMEGEFLQAYRYGAQLRTLQNKVKSLQTREQEITVSIQSFDRDIDALHAQLNAHYDRHPPRPGSLRGHIYEEHKHTLVLLDRAYDRVVRQQGLNKHGRKRLNHVMHLAKEKGQYQGQLAWALEYADARQPGSSKIKRLQARIDRLQYDIDRYDHKPEGTARHGHHDRQIGQLLELGEYSGMLKTQMALLKSRSRPSQLRALSEFHYEHEPAYVLDTEHRRETTRDPQKGVRELRRELRSVQQERDNLLIERHEIGHELEQLDRELLDFRQHNPYLGHAS